MKAFLILINIFFLLGSCGQTKESKLSVEKPIEIISDDIIYSFVNEALPQNMIYSFCDNIIDRKTLIATNGDSILLSKIDTIFSQKDKKFIRAQYLLGNKFVWKNKLLNKNIIKLDTTINDDILRKKYWHDLLDEKECFGYLELPLFNEAKNMAIVTISYNCGFLCAEGGIFIYKLDGNNQWKLHLTLEQWVS